MSYSRPAFEPKQLLRCLTESEILMQCSILSLLEAQLLLPPRHLPNIGQSKLIFFRVVVMVYSACLPYERSWFESNIFKLLCQVIDTFFEFFMFQILWRSKKLVRFYLKNKLETIKQIQTYHSKALSSATISEKSRLCSFIVQATGHLMESHRAIRQDELFDHCSPAL